MRKRTGQVTLHMYRPAKPLKNGSYSPYIRIQYEGKNYAVSTRCEVTLQEWNEYDRCPDEKHPLTVEWNKVYKAVSDLVAEGEFSFQLLRRLLQGGRHEDIQSYARRRAEQLRAEGKYSTASLCDLNASTLDQFAGGPVRFNKCTAALCTDYLRWLATDKHNSPATVSIRARNLSAILGRAVEEHIIQENPMLRVKKPFVQRKEMYISKESLDKLLSAGPESLGEKEYHHLQFFRCLYYANGLNMVDLLHLRPEDITQNEIVYTRKKTTTQNFCLKIHVPLIPELVRSLQALSGGKRYIIPLLDRVPENSKEEFRAVQQAIKTTNKYLSRVCKRLSINEKVTTNLARHAFATTLRQKGVPIEYISDAMGHTNIRTTQRYFEGYTRDQRRQNARLLTGD